MPQRSTRSRSGRNTKLFILAFIVLLGLYLWADVKRVSLNTQIIQSEGSPVSINAVSSTLPLSDTPELNAGAAAQQVIKNSQNPTSFTTTQAAKAAAKKAAADTIQVLAEKKLNSGQADSAKAAVTKVIEEVNPNQRIIKADETPSDLIAASAADIANSQTVANAIELAKLTTTPRYVNLKIRANSALRACQLTYGSDSVVPNADNTCSFATTSFPDDQTYVTTPSVAYYPCRWTLRGRCFGRSLSPQSTNCCVRGGDLNYLENAPHN